MKKSNRTVVWSLGLLFLVEMAAIQVVYRAKDFWSTPLSMYATGEFWYVMSSGLLGIAISYVLLASAFLSVRPQNRSLIAGVRLLFVVGGCTFALTVLQTDVGDIHTLRGTMHIVSAHLHFALLPVATLLISLGLRPKEWIRYRQVTITFSLVVLVVGIVLVSKHPLGIAPYSGAVQKTLVAVIVVWIMYTAGYLSGIGERKRVTAGPHPEPKPVQDGKVTVRV